LRISAIDNAIINIPYGVLYRDFARQNRKHKQRLSRIPRMVNKQPRIKNNKTKFSSTFTQDEFIEGVFLRAYCEYMKEQ
jgi:hypothetical protein